MEQCATCGALRCWSTRNWCRKCGQPRAAGNGSPLGSSNVRQGFLQPSHDRPFGAVGSAPRGTSPVSNGDGPSPLIPGLIYGPPGRGPPPKRSQTPPTNRRGPAASPKPPWGWYWAYQVL